VDFPPTRWRAGVAALTSREREVLSLMAQRRSTAGIGEVLVLSTGAVEKHVVSILRQAGPAAL
jgi:DNA-binding NarL/FixJ family response regulator